MARGFNNLPKMAPESKILAYHNEPALKERTVTEISPVNANREQLRAEMDAKYPADEVRAKLIRTVKERHANGGDVSMFPKSWSN
jgi:hypothetical protein